MCNVWIRFNFHFDHAVREQWDSWNLKYSVRGVPERYDRFRWSSSPFYSAIVYLLRSIKEVIAIKSVTGSEVCYRTEVMCIVEVVLWWSRAVGNLSTVYLVEKVDLYKIVLVGNYAGNCRRYDFWTTLTLRRTNGRIGIKFDLNHSVHYESERASERRDPKAYVLI